MGKVQLFTHDQCAFASMQIAWAFIKERWVNGWGFFTDARPKNIFKVLVLSQIFFFQKKKTPLSLLVLVLIRFILILSFVT